MAMAALLSGCEQKPASEAPPPAPVATPTVAPTPEPSPAAIANPVAEDMGESVTAWTLVAGRGPAVAEGLRPYLRIDIRDAAGATVWKGEFSFLVGSGQGFPGLDRGIRGMMPGEKRRIEIPAAQSFGMPREGEAPAEPTAVTAEVELIELETPTEPGTP